MFHWFHLLQYVSKDEAKNVYLHNSSIYILSSRPYLMKIEKVCCHL